MPTVHLTRTSEYVNAIRDYRIYIDDRFVGTIKNGGEQWFDVTPGSHTIYAKIDWCSSPTLNFTVQDNDIDFKVGAFKKAAPLVLLVTFSAIFSLLLGRFVGFPYFIILGIVGFAISVYYTTLGRKKYLQLTAL
jgi:hypothetical protein